MLNNNILNALDHNRKPQTLAAAILNNGGFVNKQCSWHGTWLETGVYYQNADIRQQVCDHVG